MSDLRFFFRSHAFLIAANKTKIYVLSFHSSARQPLANHADRPPSSISFKHNTSFVSRFSTIRRHKSSSGQGAGQHQQQTANSQFTARSRSTALGNTLSSAVDALNAQRLNETLYGSTMLTDRSRLAGSLSEDSVVTKDQISGRNSDGR